MAREFVESTWLYRTTDPIDFQKETLEKFVNLEGFFNDENSAKAALIQMAKSNDSNCNVVFDASWFVATGKFVMKGKSVKARFAV